MSALLNIIILVLIAIAIWQITRMFEFSVKSPDDKDVSHPEVATDKDNNVNGYLMFGFLAFIYLFTIYGFYKWGRFVLGTPASDHGGHYDTLFYLSIVIIVTVQILVQGLLHYFSFKYRGKKTQKALHFADNDRLEFIWTIVPVIVLSGLIIYGLWAWSSIMNIDEQEDNPLVVEIYAQQFSFKVRYAGQDNVLGSSNVRFLNDFDGKNIFGVDSADPNGLDDVFVTSELHLPVGKKILFKMRSQDVIHSAYFPHFRAQMNCVPGMITEFGFTPTVTTEEMRLNPEIVDKVRRTNIVRAKRRAKGEDLEAWQFDYVLICNKICGTSHYRMNMKIVVETQEEFDNWIAQQQTFKQVIGH